MESETISKNGASSKSHTSRVNIKILIAFFIAMYALVSVNAQEQQSPTNNFSKKEIETFDNDKFGWKTDKAKDASAKINKGYYEFKAKRGLFNPQPVKVESFAKLPMDIAKDFKITVKVYIEDLKGYGAFRILFNSGSISLAIAEGDWAVVNNTLVCQGVRKAPQKDNVTLSIQREGATLFFFYNDTLVCTSKLEHEINSSEFGLSLLNVVTSAEVKVDEVIIEQ